MLNASHCLKHKRPSSMRIMGPATFQRQYNAGRGERFFSKTCLKILVLWIWRLGVFFFVRCTNFSLDNTLEDYVFFTVATVVTIKTVVLQDVALCSLVHSHEASDERQYRSGKLHVVTLGNGLEAWKLNNNLHYSRPDMIQ